MENKDFKNFCKDLAGLGEMFGKQINDTLYELYWEFLKDLSLEDFNRAANILARTSKFFPRPVEFREQVLPDITVRASLAYNKIHNAFISAGAYSTVIFDDAVIHAVIDNLGGWVKYCNLTDDEVKWWRKDFERLYRDMYPLVARGELIPPRTLPGLYAIDSHATDTAQKPVIIGDKQKALAWVKELILEGGEGFEKVKEDLPKVQALCQGIGGARGNNN